MAHRNARLTEFGRLLLVQRITELGWPPAQAAESLGVSRATAYKWLARYRTEGRAGLADRPSRPRRCPHALTASQVRRVLAARRRRRQGPHRLSHHLAMPRSTVYGVLARHGMSRLAHLDRPSGAVVRYQRERPGELVHIDVKKLGRIPDGGGHRAHGRATASRGRGIGYDYVHSAVDDRSRVAFSQILPDETGRTAARSWSRRPGSSPSMGQDRASADRQRQGVCRVGGLCRDRRWAWDSAQAHALLPAPDEREGGAVQQDPAR
jgi:transposase